MSGSNPNGAGPSKAIGNLARKPSEAPRGGAPKLKFVPTLPARRKKEEVKQEPTPAAAPEASTSDRGRGRGRGRGEGRGRGDGTRGRGRGGARPAGPPTVEMIASGPFAMGPSAAGLTSTRGAARPTFAPAPPRASTGGAHGTSLTPTMVKVEKRGGVEARQPDEDEEAYSDQEDGVEIIDIQRVREMDWSAPEPLRKEKKREKKKNKDKKVKAEEDARVKMEKGKDAEKMEVDDEGTPVDDEADVDAANALNLSESEEEEEMEDLIEDFRARTDQDTFDANEERKLLLFQFPEPFPIFTARPPTPPPDAVSAPPADPKGKGKAPEKKGVSFAQGTKPGQATAKTPAEEAAPEEQEYFDGVIGQLEVHRSGAVKMRLANGIVMDVTAATQPSFLQQATHVDHKSKRLHVLGEVHRRFVVTPDLDVLLDEMAKLDAGVDLDNPDLQMISMEDT
ncbi:hypothetical protein PENSPDRAFT_742865 [Peniophora sp. CONT]|nr:hypothetical protein PENSPDRAFT_742865 [Peniophora sp. CONT]